MMLTFSFIISGICLGTAITKFILWIIAHPIGDESWIGIFYEKLTKERYDPKFDYVVFTILYVLLCVPLMNLFILGSLFTIYFVIRMFVFFEKIREYFLKKREKSEENK